MKALWLELDSSMPRAVKEELLEASVGLCDAVIVEEEDVELAKSYGIQVASPQGADIRILGEDEVDSIQDLKKSGGNICLKIRIEERRDEDRAVEAARMGSDCIIVRCPDWKIIPWENMIAKIKGETLLLAEVDDLEEAEIALETLEIGVDGVVLKASSVDRLEAALELVYKGEKLGELKAQHENIQLSKAKISSCRPLGLGLRACIDTCDLMQPGEGMLVGSRSSALFHIQGEVDESVYVECRPFRVNAGPVSLYILTAENRTRYLSELRGGDEVLIVDRDGNHRKSIVARVKIERRPMVLVEAEIEGREVNTIVQNAETIRFLTEDSSKPVTDLTEGDEVLVYSKPGGRHFGVLVGKELIIER